MEHVIIYREPDAYSCFPAIARGRDGELWVSFRRAGDFSVEALRRGLYDHVDKGARIALARSGDGGLSWSPPRILPAFDPECGEQDPSIASLSDGTLLVNFFRWRVVPEAEKDRLGFPARRQYDGSWADVEGPWVIRSFDGGQTWESRPVAVDSSPLARGGTSDAVLELPDGTLLMGIYGADYGSTACRAYVVRSADGGNTWGQPALIAHDPAGENSFEEPALVRLAGGQLLAVLRTREDGSYQYLHQARSDDAGRTWHSLQRTPMWGHPAHVLRLDGAGAGPQDTPGRLLCSYGYRRPPYGIRACLSSDDGQTWDIEREFVLRDDGASRDIGYPSTAQLDDGTLVTVYYIHGQDGIRHIACTRWRPDPTFQHSNVPTF